MKKLVKYIKDLGLVIALLMVYFIQLNMIFLILSGALLVLYLLYSTAYFYIIEQLSRIMRLLFSTLLQFLLSIAYFLIVWPLGFLKKLSRKHDYDSETNFHHIYKEYSIKDLENPW